MPLSRRCPLYHESQIEAAEQLLGTKDLALVDLCGGVVLDP